VTAGTYLKQHFYRTPHALDSMQQLLFKLAEQYTLQLHAWSLFSNHYHLIIEQNREPTLQTFLRHFHSQGARDRNQFDEVSGRRVWFQYQDIQLTFERSYLVRLKYVNENAVHHGMVLRATNYRWCSA